MEKQSYITGFVDGEGCFSVSFTKRRKMKFGLEVRPSFSVAQHRKSKDVIVLLHEYFKCGAIRYSKRDQNYKFEVRSVSDLIKKVIPHFEKYPLLTSKREDFRSFKNICELIHSNHHLNKKGLIEVIKLSEKVNKSGKKKYKRQDLLKLVTR